MLHTLKSKTKRKKAKLVGRGGKKGKTSGRGTKGQKSRAGHKIRPQMRDIIKKLPKLRGRGKNINKAFRIKASAVNVSMLEAMFENNASINPSVLLQKSLIARVNGKMPQVKILGAGEVTKSFQIYDCIISTTAKEKIEKAGGVIHG
jgi:large subunit ribosomal protein L15